MQGCKVDVWPPWAVILGKSVQRVFCFGFGMCSCLIGDAVILVHLGHLSILTMESENVRQVDVAIIGAGEHRIKQLTSRPQLKRWTGWYGLVAARTYLRLRPAANLLIIDSDSTVGGVWSKDRL